MKYFIARIGYIVCWAFGTPKYKLIERFDEYFRFGCFICVLSVISLLCLLGIIIYDLIKKWR